MNIHNINPEDLEEIKERLRNIVYQIKSKDNLLYTGEKKSQSGMNAIKEINFFHTEDSPEMIEIHYFNKVGELVIHKASQRYLSDKMGKFLIEELSDTIKKLNNGKEVDVYFMNSFAKNMRAVFMTVGDPGKEDSLSPEAQTLIENLPVYSYEDIFIDTMNLFDDIFYLIKEK